MSIKNQFTTKSVGQNTGNNPVTTAVTAPVITPPPIPPIVVPPIPQPSKESIQQRLLAKLQEHKRSQKNNRRPNPSPNPIPDRKEKPNLSRNSRSKKLKIIAIGGYEEVGKNCTAVEYGDDIILIDIGFQFPQKDMPGIDYVLPDLDYMIQNRHKLRAIFITHGHLDHTGAIPYLLPKLGQVPIFGSRLTMSLIKQRLDEFPDVTASMKTIDPEKDRFRLGQFEFEFFRVNHNIPDAIGLVIHSPEGSIVHTGDFKFDFTPATDTPANFQRIAQIGMKKVLVLISESTNATQPGHTISEKTIGENLDTSFSKCKGRIIVATFSSLLSRIQQVINSAHLHGRKVTFVGRSILQNVEIASKLKYFRLPANIIIPPQEINKHPDNKIVIIATGSQGQESSAVGRMAVGDHRFVQIRKNDTVILSSSAIPGNETDIYKMIDNLIRLGARVIDDKSMDIHASGHGSGDDLKTMISLLKPEYLIPAHGSLHMRNAHAQIGQELGIPEKNTILLDNGQVAEFSNHRLTSTKHKIPSGLVFVDGLGVGDVGNVVLRDRQQLSADGIIVIIAQIHGGNSKASDKDLDIISRGFVYMKEADPLIQELRQRIIKIINERDPHSHPDLSLIKNRLRDEIGSFVFDKTQRRPMIIPVTLET